MMKGKQAGMTLIELVVVIIVATLLGAGLLLVWPGRETDVHATASRLLADIRYARTLAITEKTVYQVDFDVNANSYSLLDSNGNPVNFPVGNSNTVALDSAIDFSISGLPNDKVVFNSDGSPDVDISGTALSAPAVITLQWNNSFRELRIFPYSGMTIRTDHITVPQNPQP